MENNSSTGQKVSFWEFLSQHPISIPIIQRDYAQGRKGKGTLRHNFLTSLHNALVNKKELKLDFVYGSIENNVFYPLDGQQRLTTLWLLHLYIAIKAGIQNTEKCESYKAVFRSFSYQTRSSSIEFCRQLVEYLFSCKTICENDGGESIVQLIKRQSWYYTRFRQDPTIQAMLRMLSGDDKDANNPQQNGIEQIFCGSYREMWNLLEDSNLCPIKFYYRGMMDENMPLSDDLYIKMNARGKQLTHFENFKSQFLSYNDNHFFVLTDNNKIDKEFVNHLENSWTQIFWKCRHKDKNRIDEIYFKFLNNFFLGYYVSRGKNRDTSTEDLTRTSLFERLYGKTVDRTFCPPTNEFIRISDYEPVLEEGMKTALFHTLNGLEYLLNRQNLFQQFETGLLNQYVKDSLVPFSIIPKYDYEADTSDLNNLPVNNPTQMQRIIAYALCRYCEELSMSCMQHYNERDLQDWIRVAYCVSYHTVNSQETMMGVMRLIEEMGPFCLHVKEHLSKRPNIQSKTAKEQVEEEIQKAILEKSKNNAEWYRSRIIKAELHPLFNGCIRFLLWDQDGNFNTSAQEFAMKLDFAFTHFDQNGAVRKYSVDMLRAVLAKYHFWDIHYSYQIFKNDKKTWFENILTNEHFSHGTHNLLSNGHSHNLGFFDRRLYKKDELDIEQIADKHFLKFILSKEMNMYIRWGAIYRCNSSEGIQLQRYNRDSILTSIMYSVPCRIRGLNPIRDFYPHFFWGPLSLVFFYLSKTDGRWHKIEWDRSGGYNPLTVKAFEEDLHDLIHNGKSINGLSLKDE